MHRSAAGSVTIAQPRTMRATVDSPGPIHTCQTRALTRSPTVPVNVLSPSHTNILVPNPPNSSRGPGDTDNQVSARCRWSVAAGKTSFVHQYYAQL